MNFIRNEPETLHIGADYRRGYEVSAEATKNINRNYKSGQYDVFLIHGNEFIKIVMGDIKFVHDISAH